jgi:hypothetical protein
MSGKGDRAASRLGQRLGQALLGVVSVAFLVVVGAPGAGAQSENKPDGRGTLTAELNGEPSTVEITIDPPVVTPGQTVTVRMRPTTPWPAFLKVGPPESSPNRPATGGECAQVTAGTFNGSTGVGVVFTAPSPYLEPTLDNAAAASTSRGERFVDGGPGDASSFEPLQSRLECVGPAFEEGFFVRWDVVGATLTYPDTVPSGASPGLYTVRFDPTEEPYALTWRSGSFPVIRVQASADGVPVTGTAELEGAGAAASTRLVASVAASPLTAGWLALGVALAAAGVAVSLGSSLRVGPGRRGLPGAVLAAAGAGVSGAVWAVSGSDVVGGAAVVPVVGSGVVLATGVVSPGWLVRWLPWVGGLRRRSEPPGRVAVPVAAALYGGFTGLNASLGDLGAGVAVALGVAGGLAAGGVALLTVNRTVGREVSRLSAGRSATGLTLVAYGLAVVPSVDTGVLTIVAPVAVGLVALVVMARPGRSGVADPLDGADTLDGVAGSAEGAAAVVAGSAEPFDEVTK